MSKLIDDIVKNKLFNGNLSKSNQFRIILNKVIPS